MKKMILLILVLLSFAAIAFAGDYAHFHFIGFSRDAKYLAFEEYGINDDVDDSSPYSNIYIVNVRQNRWAIEPFQARGNPSPYDANGQYDADKIETEVRDKNRRKAARQLRRFKIIDGNTGLQTAAHLINEYDTDHNEAEPTAEEIAKRKAQDANDEAEIIANTGKWADANVSMSNSNTSSSNSNSNSNSSTRVSPPKEVKHDPLDDYQIFLPQQVSFTKRGNALYRDGFYQLKIKPFPVTQKNCDQYERDMFSFELTLTNESKETRILQHSGVVPQNRGCVDGYGIQEVFIYRNYVAVFMGVFTRGWEGENLRLIAVTGKLDNVPAM